MTIQLLPPWLDPSKVDWSVDQPAQNAPSGPSMKIPGTPIHINAGGLLLIGAVLTAIAVVAREK